MSHAIAWSGFVGAWLLVAGPIYQAAIELEDEELERDELEGALASVEPPRFSAWWLLFPPAAFVQRLRRTRARRRAVMHVLTRTQLEQLMHFSETASAWLFVASGACLIAAKETWELREAYEWPTSVFWVLVVVMIAVCSANTALRVRRRDDILRQARP
jgi:hypothetical protein